MPFLLMVVLALEPPPGEGTAPHSPDAVWLSPAPTAVALSVNTVLVAVGGSYGVSPQVGLVFEAAFHGRGPYIYECANQAFGSWVSAGLTWRPLATAASRHGFFLEPKFVFHFADARNAETIVLTSPECPGRTYPNGVELDLGVGLSAGWDWVVLDHLYLGTAFGASLGLGRTRTGVIRLARTDAVDLIFHVDLSLLRVGFAW